ncbi:MAG: SDR family oxidoreductase [Phycisphaeraceae bacterium]|nr:SDR family oxidoreductase [Phycisphaeraceae bacterium]
MRVLVTGHLGYIGTILTPMLLGRGHQVVGLDSDLFRRCTFGDPAAIASVPNIRKDIRDVEAKDVQGFDACLHLAGLSNDPLGDFNPELTYDINHRASVRLADLCKKAGVKRFIFSSSCSNYGAGGDGLLTESAAFNPVTPYGESKVMVERDVAPMASGEFSPVFLRNATAYGVSPRLRFDLVLNNLTAWAYTTGQVLLKSDGTPWRPIIHIEDISRAFVATMEAPREAVHGQAFNVCGTSENYRIRELAEIVRDTVPNSKVEFAAGASPDKRNYRVSGDKYAAAFPDHLPRWTARKAAQNLYETFRKTNLTPGDFEGEKYKRITHIQSLLKEGTLTADFRFKGNSDTAERA